MPHFDKDGYETWICQVCAKIYNDLVVPVWRPDITGHKGAGNVCPTCLNDYNRRKEDADNGR